MHCVCFVHFWCDVCPTPTRNVELWIVISFLITIPLIDYYVFGHSITITFFSRLVERLQNMRNNASGDGVSNCILCGETFSFFTRHSHSPHCKHQFYKPNDLYKCTFISETVEQLPSFGLSLPPSPLWTLVSVTIGYLLLPILFLNQIKMRVGHLEGCLLSHILTVSVSDQLSSETSMCLRASPDIPSLPGSSCATFTPAWQSFNVLSPFYIFMLVSDKRLVQFWKVLAVELLKSLQASNCKVLWNWLPHIPTATRVILNMLI